LKNKDTKKRFKLFDLQREGKGISKNKKELKPGLAKFFISYKDHFGQLVSVNIYYILGNFPILFLIAAFAGVTQNTAFLPLADVFQNIAGLFAAEGAITPYKLTLFALEGLQSFNYVPTAWTYVFYGIGALTLITFGLVNVGTAYILRNIAMGDPIFLWADFWYAIKRNWKQALPFGIIDAIICVLLGFNIYSLMTTMSDFFSSLLFWSNVIIALLYFFMRFYIYVQMVTFKLSVFKIFKNSLIFALVGFKRNILAFLGIALLILFEVFFLVGLNGILIVLAVAMPLAILFSTSAYMKIFAAYYKIKEVMIDPYYEEHPELKPEQIDEEEVIMRDDVTERERLEEIKRRNGIE